MDNFDLRKYLVENKATTNSRMIKESFTPTGDKGFDNFAKEVAEMVWSAGVEDPFAAELTDWDSIFETWEDQGDLDQYTQSDIVSMAEEAGVSQDDIDYILDLPQVSKLESGEISERKHSRMLNEEMDSFDASNDIQAVINQLTDMGDAGERALATLESMDEWYDLVQFAVDGESMDSFNVSNDILTIVNQLIDMDKQDTLNILNRIDAWNDLVQSASEQ